MEKSVSEPNRSRKNKFLINLVVKLFVILVFSFFIFFDFAICSLQKKAILGNLRSNVEKIVNKFLTFDLIDERYFLENEGVEFILIYDNDLNIIKSFGSFDSFETLPHNINPVNLKYKNYDFSKSASFIAVSHIDFNDSEKYKDKLFLIKYENRAVERELHKLKNFKDWSLVFITILFLLLYRFIDFFWLIYDQLNKEDKLKILGSAQRRLAHEIKNPVAAILMQVSLIERLHPDQVEEYDIIKKEANRVLTLTDRIREFMTDTTGNIEDINIVQFIKEEVSLFTNEIIKANFYVAENSTFVSFDKIRLRSIMTNVIQNAIDAQIDKPTCKIVVNVMSAMRGKMVKIDVIDNGCGINENEKEKIFNPFYTTKNIGTGIGLSICKKFVVSRGGSIELYNRYDKNNNVLGAVCSIMLHKSETRALNLT